MPQGEINLTLLIQLNFIIFSDVVFLDTLSSSCLTSSSYLGTAVTSELCSSSNWTTIEVDSVSLGLGLLAYRALRRSLPILIVCLVGLSHRSCLLMYLLWTLDDFRCHPSVSGWWVFAFFSLFFDRCQVKEG